jgi:hypothetical protein
MSKAAVNTLETSKHVRRETGEPGKDKKEKNRLLA